MLLIEARKHGKPGARWRRIGDLAETDAPASFSNNRFGIRDIIVAECKGDHSVVLQSLGGRDRLTRPLGIGRVLDTAGFATLAVLKHGQSHTMALKLDGGLKLQVRFTHYLQPVPGKGCLDGVFDVVGGGGNRGLDLRGVVPGIGYRLDDSGGGGGLDIGRDYVDLGLQLFHLSLGNCSRLAVKLGDGAFKRGECSVKSHW